MISRTPVPPSLSSLPGPQQHRVLQTFRWFRSTASSFLIENHKRYGDVFATNLMQFGPIVFFSHPDAVRDIFTAKPGILRAGEGNAPLLPLFGSSSVLMLDGAEHLRHRRLLMPPFHGKLLAGMAETMEQFTQRHLERWSPGEQITLQTEMLDITRAVIFKTVFGIDDQLGPLSHALGEFLETLGGPITPVILTRQLQFDLGPWSPWGYFKQQRSKTDALLYAHIARQRAAHNRGERIDRSDILAMLHEARDEEDGSKMSDKELRDELITALLAGHETTATAMCWFFERLFQHPEVHHRLLQELTDVLGDRPVTGADLSNLPYLTATIHEVLRTRPVLSIVLRQTASPVTIGGIDLPEGIRVGVSIPVVHHRADVYSDPQRFDPERFLDKRPNPYALLPFGGGVRRCVGRAFALFQMKIMCATLLRRCHFAPLDPNPSRIVQRSITSAPQGGVPVRLQRPS